jgi:hypothetical protein
VANENAIFVQHRGAIGNRAQCHQGEAFQKKLTENLRNLTRLAQLACYCPGQFEGHSSTRQVRKWIFAAGQTWMNKNVGVGQSTVKFMVVGDDQGQAKSACFFRLSDRSDTAIHRDHHIRSLAA